MAGLVQGKDRRKVRQVQVQILGQEGMDSGTTRTDPEQDRTEPCRAGSGQGQVQYTSGRTRQERSPPIPNLGRPASVGGRGCRV